MNWGREKPCGMRLTPCGISKGKAACEDSLPGGMSLLVMSCMLARRLSFLFIEFRRMKYF